MSSQSEVMSVIFDKTYKFSCFLGFVSGTIQAMISDQGTNTFPVHLLVKSNLGDFRTSVDLKGNESITHSAQGVTVTITISKWHVTPSLLSFHVKAVAKRGIFSCNVLDENIRATRHNAALVEQRLAQAFANAEALHKNEDS